MTVPTTDSAMYQTIHRQPDDLRRLLREGWSQAEEAAARLRSARRVYTVGIGTSYHAALVGAWLLRAAGLDARAVSSFDFALYPASAPLSADDAVIVMSHTGTRQFSNKSMERAIAAGATRLSVGSLTAEHAGSQQVLRTVERDRSAAFTSSHLGALTVLAQLATVVGDQAHASLTGDFRVALQRLPDNVADVLSREQEVKPVAVAAATRRIYAAGAGPNEATALEAVIKVREAAQGWIDALAIEQFLHGPIVSVNEGDQAIVIQVPGHGAERVAGITRVLAAIGTHIWLVGQSVEGVNATVFALPETPELISPLLAVVPMQLFAYFMAAEKHINPDRFRRDDERYNRAFGLVQL